MFIYIFSKKSIILLIKYIQKKGFTLIELMVVISIISLLSSIVLASLSNARARSRDVKIVQELKQYQLALEMYYSKYNVYPCGDNWDDRNLFKMYHDSTLSDGFIDGPVTALAVSNCRDPKTGIRAEGFYPKGEMPKFPTGYHYYVNGNRNKYILFSGLEAHDSWEEKDNGICDSLYEIGNGFNDPSLKIVDEPYVPFLECTRAKDPL